MSKYRWPWQYNFPPFFTLQPNLATREKQLEAWSQFVLDYCQQRNIHHLDVLEAQKSDLFGNSSINRRLPLDGIRTVLEYLEKRKHIEWSDRDKRQCYVYWRTPEEWAKSVHNWVVENGFLNSVHTIHALIHDDDTSDQPFHGVDEGVLLKALQVLQSQGKAELIGNEGVKFF